MKKFVFTDSKKIFNRVLAIALAVIIVIALATTTFVVNSFAVANPKCYHKFLLSTFNGSYDAENMPSTYWQITTREADGKTFPKMAKVELPIVNYSERVLGQVWINVSDFSGDKLDIYSFYGTSGKALNKNNKPYTITANDIRNSQDGWFKVYDFNDSENFIASSNYTDDYSFTFSSSIRIREMVFIDSTNELIKDIKVIDEYFEGFKHTSDAMHPISYAVDESKYFDMKKVTK